jgi:hypothetical protein
VKRARLPTAALLALPFVVIAIQYFLYLVDHGFGLTAALDQLKKDIGLFAFLGAIPTIALAFSRELQIHQGLDRLLGVRRAVGRRITMLMQGLAQSAGYEHPERIINKQTEAMNWFYVYANQPSALRTYVFEVWEGYYVGLYLSVASALSLIGCLLLAILLQDRIAILFACLSLIIFLGVWAIRHWRTIPELMRVPSQQIAEIVPSGEVLAEARRRFG